MEIKVKLAQSDELVFSNSDEFVGFLKGLCSKSNPLIHLFVGDSVSDWKFFIEDRS